MSIGWICNSNYYDGVHKVKHKLTGEESFVELYIASFSSDQMYDVVDCKTQQVLDVEEYEHVQHYEDGRYLECSEHADGWLFDDGENCETCPQCKELEGEISSFKIAENVYQYKSNCEFNRLKYLLKAAKYRDYDNRQEYIPQQGLLVLITEYDLEWGETYYYYKTIEKSFIDELEWSEK